MIIIKTLQRQAMHATQAAASITLALVHIERAEQEAQQAGGGIAVIDQLAASKQLLRKSIAKLEVRRRRVLRKMHRLTHEEADHV